MADDAPDPQRLIKLARQTLSSAERRKKFRRIDFLDTPWWYPTQLAFFAAGSTGVHQRLIYGGSQSGKTTCCAAEVAWHLTGEYPSFWAGKRFNKPIRVWCVGESVVLVRDTVQRKLCSEEGEFGSGTIPLESFTKRPIMVPGGTGAIDTIFVRHATDGKADGTSTLTFKTFEMRRERLQSESIDLVWVDERPDEQIYSELLARTSATDGHLLVSYTPIGEGGAAGITYRFLVEASSDRAPFRITGTEAKHITAERREVLAPSYSDAERETRLEGTPQLGAGPVFPLELLPSVIKTFDANALPSWARHCVGIDFGFAGGFAAVLIAWAHDTGDIWVIDSFMMQQSSALYHVQRIHSMTQGLRIPIAWPHDGHVHDKGSGLALAQQYKGFGANMLPSHAINYGADDYRVEPGLQEIREAMFCGKLHIAGHNTELIEEMRHYHRDEDFKVVKQKDHLIDAFRYALMMRRSGKPKLECEGVGFGSMPYAGHRPERRGEPQMARGIAGQDWDIFTGQSLRE
jgi:phage terminase large subunit-like protein